MLTLENTGVPHNVLVFTSFSNQIPKGEQIMKL